MRNALRCRGPVVSLRRREGSKPLQQRRFWPTTVCRAQVSVRLLAERIWPRITHALVCGPYGQMFGTERQCLKYFTAWDPGHRIEVAPG